MNAADIIVPGSRPNRGYFYSFYTEIIYSFDIICGL